jgi:hypothetical protein
LRKTPELISSPSYQDNNGVFRIMPPAIFFNGFHFFRRADYLLERAERCPR